MDYVEGRILTDHGFEKGYIGFSSDGIQEQGNGLAPKKPKARGIIIPSCINAHTHIGDSFIRFKNINLPKDIEKLVAPPHGLKHTLLSKASNTEIIAGMKHAINEMISMGTSSFCDFREQGIKGLKQLHSAVAHQNITGIIFSRPLQMNYDKNEIDMLLKHSDGIGLSSVSDWEFSEIKKIAAHTKRKKKKFVLHASEAFREDIDMILDLKPDFLIHMTQASLSDLCRVRDENISVVLCPRSNAFFHLNLDVERMKQSKVNLLLGTDNAMINSPNVLEEAQYLLKNSNVFSPQELLDMITYSPRKVLNLDDCIQGLNRSSTIVTVEEKSLRPLYIKISGGTE